MKKFKNEQGFTLVELMVVVAIIGVLSAVAIPKFRNYQTKAKQSEAKVQLAAIHMALEVVRSESDGYTFQVNNAAATMYNIGFDAPSEGIFEYGPTAADCAGPTSVEGTPGGVCAGLANIPSGAAIGNNNYTVGAIGSIGASGFDNNGQTGLDRGDCLWTIDEERSLNGDGCQI